MTGKELRPNILDTSWCFYLPSLFSVGLRSGILIYIYHQFFLGLPKELEEAAWIDGSAPPRTFLCIALPSSTVAVITVFVLSLVWHWNDYYLAVMYTSENFPLAVSLASLPKALASRHMAGQHFEYNRCYGRMCYVCNADSAVLFDFAA